MKNILRIAAIAVLSVFAVVSCAPPEADITGFPYGDAAKRYGTENNKADTSSYTVSMAKVTNTEDPTNGNMWVNITFPKEADILLKTTNAEILSTLGTFLTLHTYTNPETTSTKMVGLAKISDLSAPLTGINVIKRTTTTTLLGGTKGVITIEVPKTQTEYEAGNHVFVLNSQKYTFNGGLKLDKDGNGKAGETGYDDYYFLATGTGNNTFYGKENNNYSFTVSFSPTVQWSNASATTSNNLTSILLASLSAFGYLTSDHEARTEEIAYYILSRGKIKLQKFNESSKKWDDVKEAKILQTTSGTYFFGVQDTTLDHDCYYRAFWTGPANMVTDKEYFGLRQRISVYGDSPSTSGSTNKQEAYSRTEMASNSTLVWNSFVTTRTEVREDGYPYDNLGNKNPISKDDNPIAAEVIKSKDFSNKDVVIKLTFPIMGTSNISTTDPFVGLDDGSFDAKGFKIAYGRDASGGMNGIDVNNTNSNYINYVGIKGKPVFGYSDVEYWDSTTSKNVKNSEKKFGYDTMEITLDSSYRYTNATKNLHIFLNSSGLKYKGTTRYVFGDRSNLVNDGLRGYYIALPELDNEPSPITPAPRPPEELEYTYGSWAQPGSGAEIFVSENNGMYIANVTKTSDTNWHANIGFYFKSVAGQKYKYSFKIKTLSGERDVFIQYYWKDGVGSGGKSLWFTDYNDSSDPDNEYYKQYNDGSDFNGEFDTEDGWVNVEFDGEKIPSNFGVANLEIQLGDTEGIVLIKDVKIEKIN